MPETTITTKLSSLERDIDNTDERQTAVKVDRVTMEFNMASEKLGSLKEYAIALAKRKLFFESFIALDDISFDVKKGDVYGILGTNGSGKSTLLKIIAGVLKPTKGNIEVNGNIAPLIELGAGFDMELSARENIFLNGALLGYSRSFIQEHFDAIVEFAEIEKFLDMPMKNYSSGMISRIAFAIATVIIPDILIVDEVLSVGDFMFQQKCEGRIKDLIENHGVTVLIVSHSNEQIERLCNKAIWIEKGHVRINGDAARVCNAYRAIGGRAGSQQSESVIVRALNLAESDTIQPVNYATIGGTDSYEVNANTALFGWNAESCNAIVLVPFHSHSYAISMSGIAGALDAPVLPFSADGIDSFAAASIRALAPDSIYILGTENDFAAVSKSLEATGISSRRVRIPLGDDPALNEGNIMKFGVSSQLLNPQAALLCSFSDVYPAFAAASVAYRNRMPFAVVNKDVDDFSHRQVETFKQIGTQDFIVVGSFCNDPIVAELESVGRSVTLCEGPHKPEIFGLTDPAQFDNSKLCIASGSLMHWMELRGAPALCGKLGIPIMFEDETNLDSKAECIEYVRDNGPSELLFLGSSSISEIDKRMLACSSRMGHSS